MLAHIPLQPALTKALVVAILVTLLATVPSLVSRAETALTAVRLGNC